MSRDGNCWDNASMERFFAKLKNELVHHQHCRTYEEPRHSLFDDLEFIYNRVHRFSRLVDLSPEQFEQAISFS